MGRDYEEVEDTIERAVEVQEKGRGLEIQYAAGVEAALRWVLEDTDDNPMDGLGLYRRPRKRR